MSLTAIGPLERIPPVEWPTVFLIIAVYCAWLALTWFHDALPLWLWIPLAAVTLAFWGSLQHEIMHGHPTRSRAINTALATPPLWLWLPFERYRATHVDHHRDAHLTDPIEDPETYYWTPEDWRALGPVGRFLVELQSTLLGRLIIGPIWSVGGFLATEARVLWAGDRDRWRVWAWHVLWVSLVSAWAFVICDMPIWQYVVGFVYIGLAVTFIRSFAEHRAAASAAQRTAVVENSPLLGFLFLHNNLHVVHHALPAVPWYQLPRLYRMNRAAVLAANGGLVYDGYLDVFRRFLLKRHDQSVHPLGRASPQNES
jgi:fatty acid desaturase